MAHGIRLNAASFDPPVAATGGRLWLTIAGALALLALAGAVLPATAAGWLDWQPARAAREPWRSVSAVMVHHSALHLAANLLGAVGVGLLGRAGELPRRSGVAWLLAWPATQLGLLVQPELTHYAGLSGVLHAGVAVAGVHLLCCRTGAQRLIGAALLGALVVKIGVEAPWAAVLVQPLGWDIAIAPAAHASGAVAGGAAAALIELLHATRQRGGSAA